MIKLEGKIPITNFVATRANGSSSGSAWRTPKRVKAATVAIVLTLTLFEHQMRMLRQDMVTKDKDTALRVGMAPRITPPRHATHAILCPPQPKVQATRRQVGGIWGV